MDEERKKKVQHSIADQAKPIPPVHKRWLEAAEDNVEILRTMVHPGFSNPARFSAIWYAECIVALQDKVAHLNKELAEARAEPRLSGGTDSRPT